MISENMGHEMKKPRLNFGKPSFDMEKLLDKQMQELANEDLEELEMKHGIIHDMEYVTKMPDDIRKNGNVCSDAEYERLNAGIKYTLGVVQKSMANYDEAKFRKWFGVNNEK